MVAEVQTELTALLGQWQEDVPIDDAGKDGQCLWKASREEVKGQQKRLLGKGSTGFGKSQVCNPPPQSPIPNPILNLFLISAFPMNQAIKVTCTIQAKNTRNS